MGRTYTTVPAPENCMVPVFRECVRVSSVNQSAAYFNRSARLLLSFPQCDVSDHPLRRVLTSSASSDAVRRGVDRRGLDRGIAVGRAVRCVFRGGPAMYVASRA